jgi:hypothetical protein
MKTVTLICLMLVALISNNIYGQPSEAVAKEKMKPFAQWAGHWQGEGFMQMGPGPQKKSNVEEHLEFKLDSAVMLIEGLGKSIGGNENKVVHNAMAVLSFDQSARQYKFNTYLKDGRATQAWFNIIEDGRYQWGFDTPNGKIKYSITLDTSKKVWNEIGEFSNDGGTTWMKFFEMNLKKVEAN